jgi:hypothetical protein
LQKFIIIHPKHLKSMNIPLGLETLIYLSRHSSSLYECKMSIVIRTYWRTLINILTNIKINKYTYFPHYKTVQSGNIKTNQRAELQPNKQNIANPTTLYIHK